MRKIRSQIFRQIAVQDGGKYASRFRTKPSGELCVVLPEDQVLKRLRKKWYISGVTVEPSWPPPGTEIQI